MIYLFLMPTPTTEYRTARMAVLWGEYKPISTSQLYQYCWMRQVGEMVVSVARISGVYTTTPFFNMMFA